MMGMSDTSPAAKSTGIMDRRSMAEVGVALAIRAGNDLMPPVIPVNAAKILNIVNDCHFSIVFFCVGCSGSTPVTTKFRDDGK